ncbi:MAG: hypothetical protein Q7L55_07580 [Actinomycetota bacterium]|nr:hypothetical protein [Actinomycetota bacterium]
MNFKFAVLVSGIGLVVSLGLAGCSNSDSSADVTTSPSPSTSVIGGMTECTQAAIEPTLLAELKGDSQLMDFSHLMCGDGWATVNGLIGDGKQGAPTAFIFEQEGQFWIPKQAADVCGTINYKTDPVAYPKDALVPEALFESACLT